MIITYKLPRENLTKDTFLEEYVVPLGKSCMWAQLTNQHGATIHLGRADCLSLARVAILVACGISDDWELSKRIEEPSHSWAGDLAPDSVEFSIARKGEPDMTHEIHILEIPDEVRHEERRWRQGATIQVTDETGYFTIFGNAAGLLSFADHLALLASPSAPSGTLFRYTPGRDLDRSSLALAIERVDPSDA